jgi:hypothetical protein
MATFVRLRLDVKKTCWLNSLYRQRLCPAMAQRIAGSMGVGTLWMATGVVAAQIATPFGQVPTTATQPVAPNGYMLHETIDMGGHIANITGSGAMYDTLVNIQSGPRVLG